MEKDARYYYGVGFEYLHEKEIKSAIKYFLKSLDLDCHFKTYHRLYECYNYLEEYDLANYFIKMAYESNINNDKVAFDYSMSLVNKNEINKAKEILASIFNRNSSYKKAKEEYIKICNLAKDDCSKVSPEQDDGSYTEQSSFDA